MCRTYCRRIGKFFFALANSMAWIVVAEVILAWEIGSRLLEVLRQYMLAMIEDCMRLHTRLSAKQQPALNSFKQSLGGSINSVIKETVSSLSARSFLWDFDAYWDKLLSSLTGNPHKTA